MQSILDEIKAERAKQNAKWGEQNHDPFKWRRIFRTGTKQCRTSASVF
jgi:hypothetical protein